MTTSRRVIRDMIFSIAIGPTLIACTIIAYKYAEQIDQFFGEVLKFLILGK